MSPSSLRLRILTAIGASGLAILASEACGTSSPQPAPALDAGSDTATTSMTDSAGPEPEASADTSTDVAPDRMSVRRPLLVGSRLRSASPVPREDWLAAATEPPPQDVDPGTLAALAKAYGLDGCEEHASIAAFARLTLHLLAVGAPPELVEKAHLASLDEIRHARTCFTLAHRYGGVAVGPGPLAVDDLFGASPGMPPGLAEIAAVCAEEGCVGETLGVLLAEATLARTTDPVVRATLSAMVTEEAAHVELAWRVVGWCIAQGGEPVRAAVARAIDRGIAATLATEVRRYAGIDLRAWNAHGRATCEQARAVATVGIAQVIEPCASVLLQKPENRRGAENAVSSRA
jgi:hypothetical protein